MTCSLVTLTAQEVVDRVAERFRDGRWRYYIAYDQP
jgi:hypothetical protein